METNNLKVLAIDDNQDNLTTLKAVISDRLPGTKILTALDGQTGIQLAIEEDPDVILLDIVMPGMDGFSVCLKLKEDTRLHAIPVLFLTALRTDQESRVKALEVGAEGFLPKPFDEFELTAQIRSMAKIKAANRLGRMDKERLAELVFEQTQDLARKLEERKLVEKQLKDQMHELQRWHDVMLDREDRIQELKREVNELCRSFGEPARYASQEAGTADSAITPLEVSGK